MSDEVFAKVVKLCFEAKVSRWEHHVSNFGSNIDCALCNDQGGACVRKTNCVSCAWFIREKVRMEKRSCSQKRAEVGQQDNEDQIFV